jgi:hypothetical protein
VKGKPARAIEKRILSSVPIIGQKKKTTTILFSMSMYRYPHPRTINVAERMLNDLQSNRPDIDIIMGRTLATGLIASRRIQFELAQQTNADYLAIVDDDMYWPQTKEFNALEALLALDKDIISAVCFTRQMPIMCLVSISEDGTEKLEDTSLIKAGKPFQAKWTGFGFILIKRKVIDKLADYCGGVKNIPNLETNWRKMPQTHDLLSAARTPEEVMDAVDWLQRRATHFYEDYSFCKKARECGFEIWADPSFEVAHVGDYDYGVSDWIYMIERQAKEKANAGNSA